ncbi:hypothetical protein ACFQDN_20500 [Pseudomonas asuensis]|uniref:hypothetical protein n=1 Tax=Pseudomonas asuensis TaxID=1825787 RepID=UPI001664F815|nr:hypothetical protein [Pseudomonas asuensis]
MLKPDGQAEIKSASESKKAKDKISYIFNVALHNQALWTQLRSLGSMHISGSPNGNGIFRSFLFLVASSSPAVNWLMLHITMNKAVGLYSFLFWISCLIGMLLVIQKVGAVLARYIALLASTLSACLLC